MNTVDGYAISSWERGYGDMEFVLDWDTLRLLPHLPATAMVQCDLVWLDHAPVVQSPRTILQAPARPGRRARAWSPSPAPSSSSSSSTRPTRTPTTARYRDLTPVNQYNVDYSILGTTRVEPLLRDIRNHMYAAGLDVEGAKGECNFGQHEIGFLYADALTTADNHAVYKTAAKEIAAQHGKAITFMAKYDEREGNSCHIHLSLRGDRRRASCSGTATASAPPLYDQFVAGVLATMRRLHAALRAEHQLLQAVRRRLVRADRDRVGHSTTAPARSGWSATAPAPGWRTGCPAATSTRTSRWPRCSPAACTASRTSSSSRTSWSATPTPPTSRTCRTRCARPATRSPPRTIARAAFGDDVVDHYVNMADVELAAFDAAVTDWELRRGFERL